MAEAPECQLRRRRRSSGNPNLPLNLEVGFTIKEGEPCQGTPSPSCFKSMNARGSANPALAEFRNKQQSFDIQIEECEEEEIIVDSEEEGEADEAAGVDRPVTPMPIQDFGANVVHTEGPQTTDFLKVKPMEQDGFTDVSDADSEEEE